MLCRFDEEMIYWLPIVAPYFDLDEPSSIEEFEAALSKLGSCKADEKSGILSEILWQSNTLGQAVAVDAKDGEVVADWKKC